MKRLHKNWLVRVTVGFAALTGMRLISTFLHLTTLEKLYKPRDFRKTSHLKIDPAILDSLPKSCTNLFGQDMDPINLIFVGSESGINHSFEKAGWTGAHPSTPIHWFYVVVSGLTKRRYKKWPFMPLFISIGLQDMSFQKSPENKFGERHHIRIWRTRHEINGRRLWVAAATHEFSMKFIIAPPWVVHRMNPNLDYERDYIAADLIEAGSLMAGEYQLNEPISLKGAKKNPHGDKFYTDGSAKIIEIV